MTDRLLKLSQQPTTRRILKGIGLPTPMKLARGEGPYADQPLAGVRTVFAAADGGFASAAARSALEAAGAEPLDSAAALGEAERAGAVVFDATGVASADDLKALYRFFNPLMPRIGNNARVLLLTGLPEQARDSAQAAAWRGLEGFTRALGKELGKRGTTANLFYIEPGAEADRLEAPLRFFLSPHSAFVDGQPVRITRTATAPQALPLTQPLAGKVALVTGGARGIGAATARRLAAEGAKVICLDIPADAETLNQTVAEIGGTALPLDITDAAAPQTIVDFCKENFGGVDIVVHNAGVTRDKTLAKMPEHYWDMVLAINLGAILAIDAALHDSGTLRDGGRIVCLSSIGGIAGNVGQTNYAATKAALIGYVAAEAARHGARGICINAVAPGFIETRMTAAMPFTIREAGRRMSSLSQGGQPEDVAELIVFLSTPGASGITGNTIRVCGQSLIGA